MKAVVVPSSEEPGKSELHAKPPFNLIIYNVLSDVFRNSYPEATVKNIYSRQISQLSVLECFLLSPDLFCSCYCSR